MNNSKKNMQETTTQESINSINPQLNSNLDASNTLANPIMQNETGKINNKGLDDSSKPPSTQLVYAGFFKRFIATIVDGLILMTVNLIFQTAFTFVSSMALNMGTMSDIEIDSAISIINGIGSVITIVINLIYTIGFLMLRGATPGKMALKLVVVATSGEKASFGKIALREMVGKFISTLFFLLGYFWIIWDDKKQAWHDKIAGTVVIVNE
jgi:uncharacterized RDD family membrane protein YckC